MAIWIVRGGKHGEQEQRMLDHNVICIGWDDLGDLSNVKSKDELRTLYENTYPGKAPITIGIHIGQIWAFRELIQPGDHVVAPMKTTYAIAVGKVTSKYKHRTDLGEDLIHTRDVEWIDKQVQRSNFPQDLLYSFGSLLTVCQPNREKAEERVLKIAKGIPDKGDNGGGEPPEPVDVDIEQIAKDRIVATIEKYFKGHNLAMLIETVLNAQGYYTRLSQPGPDGGVDILAGSGAMGFDSPKICVQVKSTSAAVDVNVLRGLKGTMDSFGADQGLLVSWGGFTQSTIKESTNSFFKVRLWDQGDILNMVQKHYDKLPEEIQAKLPLKRIWILTESEDEG